MKLHNEELQWIYDNTERLKQAVVVLDAAKQWKIPADDRMRKEADELVHDLAFSFLMVAMGEHIPKSLWNVNDYSLLYGMLMDGNDSSEIEITNDQ